jgi:hypothetical protein
MNTVMIKASTAVQHVLRTIYRDDRTETCFHTTIVITLATVNPVPDSLPERAPLVSRTGIKYGTLTPYNEVLLIGGGQRRPHSGPNV